MVNICLDLLNLCLIPFSQVSNLIVFVPFSFLLCVFLLCFVRRLMSR